MINRDFTADRPLQKVATDVTQINIGGSKIYLSPVLDMFNGEILSYVISESPNLKMVMDMLLTGDCEGYVSGIAGMDSMPLLYRQQMVELTAQHRALVDVDIVRVYAAQLYARGVVAAVDERLALLLKQTQIFRPICTDCLRHLRICAR